jgi:hypothetical protein
MAASKHPDQPDSGDCRGCGADVAKLHTHVAILQAAFPPLGRGRAGRRRPVPSQHHRAWAAAARLAARPECPAAVRAWSGCVSACKQLLESPATQGTGSIDQQGSFNLCHAYRASHEGQDGAATPKPFCCLLVLELEAAHIRLDNVIPAAACRRVLSSAHCIC